VRQRFEGLAPFVGTALVFVVVGLLAVLLEIQSPSFVLWSGIKVQGDTYRGLTHYVYDDENYTVDNRAASPGDRRHVPTTVWLSRSDPEDASRTYIENARTRWLDFSFVVGWFVLAALVMTIGFLYRWRRRRRRIIAMGEFGSGISDEFVRRMLTDRRQPVDRPTISFDE
jgi:hypothetical protein